MRKSPSQDNQTSHRSRHGKHRKSLQKRWPMVTLCSKHKKDPLKGQTRQVERMLIPPASSILYALCGSLCPYKSASPKPSSWGSLHRTKVHTSSGECSRYSERLGNIVSTSISHQHDITILLSVHAPDSESLFPLIVQCEQNWRSLTQLHGDQTHWVCIRVRLVRKPLKSYRFPTLECSREGFQRTTSNDVNGR
jgi:hypothetical protein